jgi:DNA-binding CsgD family transcriptional regulator
VVPNGERGLIVEVLPMLCPVGVPALQMAKAIVLVQDPGCDRPFDPAVARDAFRLTLGVARLASLVGTGTASGEAAVVLAITEATARSVLKRVFDKMGVSRQSEMAALISKLLMLRQQ